MTPEETVRAYYDALRAGEPLAPFFASRSDLVKFGVSERLDGFEDVSRGLREQTRTTADWTVDSERLRTASRGAVAWFSDDVALAWTDVETGDRHGFDTRWSGTLERRADAEGNPEADRPGEWRFVGMHVSAPHDI